LYEAQDSASGIEFSRPVKIQFNGYVSGPGRSLVQPEFWPGCGDL